MSEGSVSVPLRLDDVARVWLERQLTAIEDHLNADVLFIYGPIGYGVDTRIRIALDGIGNRRETLLVILDTPGGVVEVVERIVLTIRHHYTEVKYLVPDRAMSAGTVLVMSGDVILMDYHSCLGPVDPQIERDGRFVPALSYLTQYERFVEKSKKGELTTAEVVLLQQLNLAELHQFELAAALSVTLIQEWLVKYKFKDWIKTEGREIPVTEQTKRERAEAIATALNDHQRWLSHGRGIHMDTLRSELNLKIDDYSADPQLKQLVWDYFWFFRNYLAERQVSSFVHSRTYF